MTERMITIPETQISPAQYYGLQVALVMYIGQLKEELNWLKSQEWGQPEGADSPVLIRMRIAVIQHAVDDLMQVDFLLSGLDSEGGQDA